MKNLLAQVKTDLGPIQLTPKGFTASFGNDPAGRLEKIISNIVGVFTIFAGISFVIYFLIGAVTWVTAGGHPDTLDKAKQQMSTALVGLFITIVGVGVMYVLGEVTGLKILNPADIIDNLTP
ncbi:MAG TPA: hypothetical protein VJ242_03830 [Patescibacteria group bacterium]|uniref:Uncharacterized protein n=1 Tax=Candidatus Chisholmbacteria bacterium RIFCSPHIGHO2_01_FULL_52_32 TaxID=1797591 RepID=A0A1G1VQW0_9BACT|nr:MAG: hypothetical protein A2786_00025 [Candidatus Chisholmbacteria bacterium RIFCSPHIGHO2_01_FULL_52_32]HKZ35818.1 hypothetical protein [Patescibacteria group bacterium]